MSDEKVLVFIPVKNEEKTIKKIIEDILQKNPSWDVLVVDDNSNDGTISEVKKTKAMLVTLILATRGHSSVLAAFLLAARKKYNYLLKIDGDDQQEIDVLNDLVSALKQSHADIAIGSRYVKKMEETDSFLRVVGRVFSSALVNFKIRGKNNISDCTSGIRGCNAKAIKLLNEIYSKNSIKHETVYLQHEIILASRLGLKIVEVPAFFNKRKFGKSKSFSSANMFTYPFRLMLLLIN